MRPLSNRGHAPQSSTQDYTPDQWANLNAQADAIYADFTQKVAAGRKLPLQQVQQIAKGRVWTGADARPRGLVDQLGGFWTAVCAVKQLAGIAPGDRVTFKRFPRPVSFFDAMDETFSSTSAGLRAMQGLAVIARAPMVREAIEAFGETPKGGIELRATGLPVD